MAEGLVKKTRYQQAHKEPFEGAFRQIAENLQQGEKRRDVAGMRAALSQARSLCQAAVLGGLLPCAQASFELWMLAFRAVAEELSERLPATGWFISNARPVAEKDRKMRSEEGRIENVSRQLREECETAWKFMDVMSGHGTRSSSTYRFAMPLTRANLSAAGRRATVMLFRGEVLLYTARGLQFSALRMISGFDGELVCLLGTAMELYEGALDVIKGECALFEPIFLQAVLRLVLLKVSLGQRREALDELQKGLAESRKSFQSILVSPWQERSLVSELRRLEQLKEYISNIMANRVESAKEALEKKLDKFKPTKKPPFILERL